MNSFASGISIKKLWEEAPLASVLAATNILVFVYQMLMRQIDGYYSVETWGALQKALIFDNGEYYRIITAGFLHWDLMHILFNAAFGIVIITSFLERKIGSLRTGLIYFSSMLISGLLTAALADFGADPGDPLVWTLGASGAIFGVLGTLLYMSFFRLDLMSAHDVRSIRSLILINLVFTFAVGSVSNVGHVSGLIAGFLVAFLFVPKDKAEYEIYH